jgi:hypothetical protein
LTLTNPTYKIVVSFNKFSQVEEDRVMNTFHYEGPASPSTGDMSNWINHFYEWFNVAAPFTGIKMQIYFSKALAIGANAFTVQFFRLPANTGNTGSPIATYTQSISTAWAVTPALPNEVAACLTLQSFQTGQLPEEGPGDTRPAARRRNRLYLGPLNTAALSEVTTTHEPKLHDSFTGTVVYAYKESMVDGMQAAGWTPVCFSRANWDAHRPLVVWMDDQPDTQRRRGNDPTMKTSVSV